MQNVETPHGDSLSVLVGWCHWVGHYLVGICWKTVSCIMYTYYVVFMDKSPWVYDSNKFWQRYSALKRMFYFHMEFQKIMHWFRTITNQFIPIHTEIRNVSSPTRCSQSNWSLRSKYAWEVLAAKIKPLLGTSKRCRKPWFNSFGRDRQGCTPIPTGSSSGKSLYKAYNTGYLWVIIPKNP